MTRSDRQRWVAIFLGTLLFSGFLGLIGSIDGVGWCAFIGTFIIVFGIFTAIELIAWIVSKVP